uniref:GAIN-B domain-containing protein n=1 Tax=Amphimedon queenslandica TaxID=400682 RepID=A0A1X7TGE0_AMPQE
MVLVIKEHLMLQDIVILMEDGVNLTAVSINISHYVALESLSEQLNDFPAAQSIVLLDFIITNSTMESDNETTQIVLDIASEIIQMASNKTDGVSIFSQLLMTLDNFALNVRQDLSLSTDSIFLNVKQIQDFPDEEATAIDYNGNTLTLANVIFTALPATVASFVYEDLSVLSPTNDDELISPVISSTVRCNGTCNTNDLDRKVTITFNLSDVQQSLNGKNVSCVFWKFNTISNDSLPTGYWDKEGCTSVLTSESSVTCKCNHLTHFAILLSPRSEEPSPVHTKILTIAGQILVPISL